MYERLFVIEPPAGYAPLVGRLVSMLEFVRTTTFMSAKGLTTPQLDYLHDAESNSIGALILHAGAVELSYTVSTLEDREMNAEEKRDWGAALSLGEKARTAIRGQDLSWYEQRLATVRARTLAGLKAKDDAWLDVEEPFWGGKPANRLFMWFHVLEDEINHRGQIRWLAKRARAANT